MAVRTIEVPDLPFAGFYYPEILRDTLALFRRNVEEIGLTDENEFEVHVQLIRAFAFVGSAVRVPRTRTADPCVRFRRAPE